MMDILKCQAIYNGNIENIVHSADLKNGSVVAVGAINTDFAGNEVFNAVLPATGDLATVEYLIVAQGEYSYENGETDVASFTNVKDIPFMAMHLTEGDTFKLAKTDFSGTAVVGQFLIPADGTGTLAVSATRGTTVTAFEIKSITEKIGYAKADAVLIKAVK